MRHAGSNDRQSERHIDSPVETDRLERDMALVMVHRHDGVERTRKGVVKQGVIGKRTGNVDTRRERRRRRPG